MTAPKFNIGGYIPSNDRCSKSGEFVSVMFDNPDLDLIFGNAASGNHGVFSLN